MSNIRWRRDKVSQHRANCHHEVTSVPVGAQGYWPSSVDGMTLATKAPYTSWAKGLLSDRKRCGKGDSNASA